MAIDLTIVRDSVSVQFFENQVLPLVPQIELLACEWDKVNADIESLFNHDVSPGKILLIDVETQFLSRCKKKPFALIGLSGPGAVGKNAFRCSLGLPKVVNTTTRPPRGNEENGSDYFFVSEDQFRYSEQKGDFLITSFREGRGYYGISRNAIVSASNTNPYVLEESPANLHSIWTKTNTSCEMLLIYLLPPDPIFLTLLSRLSYRCQNDGTNLSSTLISTLGQRQIEELRSLRGIIDTGLPVLILINDDVSRIVNLAREKF